MIPTSPQEMDNTVSISLNVPEELRDDIDQVARAKMLSRAAWIRTTLAEHVAEQLPKQLPPDFHQSSQQPNTASTWTSRSKK